MIIDNSKHRIMEIFTIIMVSLFLLCIREIAQQINYVSRFFIPGPPVIVKSVALAPEGGYLICFT